MTQSSDDRKPPAGQVDPAAEAARLVASHGRHRAAQHAVDLVQQSIRQSDDHHTLFYDRVLRIIEAMPDPAHNGGAASH